MSDNAQDYVITVATRADDHTSEPRVSAVIRIDDDATPYIVELTVRPADPGESSAHAVRDIDFEQLTTALLTTVATSARIAPASSGQSRTRRRDDKPAEPRGGGRPYRKMPPVDEVKAVFLATESVGKLANHFDVPRYTAQSWVDRLRRTGQLEPPVAS